MRRRRDRSPARATPPPDTPVTARIRPPRRAGPRPEVEPKAHGLLPTGTGRPMPCPPFSGVVGKVQLSQRSCPRRSRWTASNESCGGCFGAASGRPPGLGPVAIREEPRNAQQLAGALVLDYKTVRHHLRVLGKNGLVTTAGERYGQVYFLSPSMESHWTVFESIVKDMKTRGDRRAAK